MRRIGRIALVSGFLLAGCSAEEGERAAIDSDVENRTPYERLDNTADTSQSYETPGAAPVTPVQGGRTVGGPLTATGQFQGIAQNAPPGSVTVTEEGDATRVSILIHRYTEGTELQAAIVNGSCQNPGAVMQTVPGEIRVGQGGVATLNAVIPVRTADLLDGRHSIRLANPGATAPAANAPEMVFACADLPALR